MAAPKRRRDSRWLLPSLLILVGLAGVQTVFLAVQARQGAFLLQGLERLGDARASTLTQRLDDLLKMGWIRCFQLAEEIPSAEKRDDHACGRLSWLEGIAPARATILGDGGKVFELRIETVPTPEYTGLLWITRALALSGMLGLGWSVSRRA